MLGKPLGKILKNWPNIFMNIGICFSPSIVYVSLIAIFLNSLDGICLYSGRWYPVIFMLVMSLQTYPPSDHQQLTILTWGYHNLTQYTLAMLSVLIYPQYSLTLPVCRCLFDWQVWLDVLWQLYTISIFLSQIVKKINGTLTDVVIFRKYIKVLCNKSLGMDRILDW